MRFLNVSNLPEKANYTEWENQFLRVLKKHAPLKSKIIGGNNKPFVKKALRKAIIKDIISNMLYGKKRKAGNQQKAF